LFYLPFLAASFLNDAFDELDIKDLRDFELTDHFGLLFDVIYEQTDSLSS
jgi:hypothetical protein